MQPNSTRSERLAWSPKEWGAAVGISHSTVYELIAKREIEAVRLGGKRLITTSPAAFIESLKQKSTVA